MLHKNIQIKDLSLSFPHKICFENFTCQISYGSRIGIIGRNGSGKSTLLKMIAGTFGSSGGTIHVPEGVVCGYVPQVIDDFNQLSGGERLNKAITQAVSLYPAILLLDEPTNHLDQINRNNLMRMMKSYAGTIIIVSHDTEILRNCIGTLWHIDNGKIHIFSGNYEDYSREIKLKRTSIAHDLARLRCERKVMHDKLMQEQQRVARVRIKGEKNVINCKWTKMVGDLKVMKAEKSQGKKLSAIAETKKALTNQLAALYLPEIIVPKFSISNEGVNNCVLVQITGGAIGYVPDHPLLSNINLTVSAKDRLAIRGDNGSGKSTLLKAILGDPTVYKEGGWFIPPYIDIGYLDQHYSTLDPNKTVLEVISTLVSHWTTAAVRYHLNDFLFRKNEEVNALINTLSGGEKARLSLAQIAARTPKVLMLDEITNNLDLETKAHVVQVLKAYPGAMLIVSHDGDFLEKVGVGDEINVQKFKRKEVLDTLLY